MTDNNTVTMTQFNELMTMVKGLQEGLTALSQTPPDPPTDPTPPPTPPPASDPPPSQFAEMQQQLALMNANINTLREENNKLKSDAKAADFKRERDLVVNFVEGLIRDRKVLPSEKEQKVALLMAVDNANTVNYTETDGRKTSKSTRDLLMDQMKDGPDLYSSGQLPDGPEWDPEFAEAHGNPYYYLDMGDVDQDSLRLDQKIRKYAKDTGLNPDKPEDYAEAYDRYTMSRGIVQ